MASNFSSALHQADGVTFGDDILPGRRLGNYSDNCSCVVLTSSVPAGRLRCSTFRHLGNCSCIALLSYVRVGHLSVARARGAFVVADVQGCTSVAGAGCAGATKVTKTIFCPRTCCAGMHECRERMDPLERPAPASPVPSLNACLRRFSDGTSMCRVERAASCLRPFGFGLRLRAS